MNMCVQHHASAALPTEISVPIEAEAVCVLEPFWIFLEKKIISCSSRNSNSRSSNPKKKNSYFLNIINGLSVLW
jgi:hypothetical protein